VSSCGLPTTDRPPATATGTARFPTIPRIFEARVSAIAAWSADWPSPPRDEARESLAPTSDPSPPPPVTSSIMPPPHRARLYLQIRVRAMLALQQCPRLMSRLTSVR
jgi:hypothetical protein